MELKFVLKKIEGEAVEEFEFDCLEALQVKVEELCPKVEEKPVEPALEGQ